MRLAECLTINANYSTIYTAIVEGQSETCKTASVNFADHFHDMRMSPAAVKSIRKAVNVILYLSRQAHYKAAYQEAAVKNFHKHESKQEKLNVSNVGCTTKRSTEVREDAKNAVISDKIEQHRAARKATLNRHLCTFITLTLPSKQTHSDIEITKFCVNPFLSYARKYWGVRHYIWKKELQKNGNLHYHFVTDRYIDCANLRRAWNRIINQGKVSEDVAPFDYVDRYKYRMQDLYSDGWNDDKMLKVVAKSPYVAAKIAEEVKAFEKKEQREISLVEYRQIETRNQFEELERMRKAYHAEMDKDESVRWTIPPSTDISAIRTPRSVSAYVAKYIAKDIDDDPELAGYLEEVRHYKEMIFFCLKDIAKKKENNEPITDDDITNLNHWKTLLKEVREFCPIKGKLWFKSASLTPFLKGAGGCPKLTEQDIKNGIRKEDGIIDSQLNNELQRLMAYLKDKETKSNSRKIITTYGTNKDGSIDLNNIICITLLINIFELQMMRDGQRYRYPAIVGMWQRFVRNCKVQNLKRGLYRRKKMEDNELINVK